MEALKALTSAVVALPAENIDTDQIIPARFLTTTRFDGLGEGAFADWRFDDDGQPRPDCVLNTPEARHRSVLVAGRNFGCGSSREHAPRALLDFGFRVVISNQIADIFRNNALTCGLLAIEVGEAEQRWMLDHPDEPITVDLEACYLELANGHRCGFEVDPFARHCLLSGTDKFGYLLSRIPQIEAYEERIA